MQNVRITDPLAVPLNCWGGKGSPSKDYCDFCINKTCQQWQHNSHSPSQKKTFFPLMVAITYKIVTGTDSWDDFHKGTHPTMWLGDNLPPTLRGLTPHHQGKGHLRWNQSTQRAVSVYMHNGLWRRWRQHKAKKSTFVQHLVRGIRRKALSPPSYWIPMRPLC